MDPKPTLNVRITSPAAGAAQRALLLAALMCAAVLVVGQLYLVIPLENSVADRFGVAPAAATWIGPAFGFAYAAGFIVSGSLADRWGNRRVLRVSLALLALTTVLAAAAPDFVLLLIARVVQGLSASLFPPAALALVGAETHVRRRTLNISFLSFALLGAAPISQFAAEHLRAAGLGLSEVMWLLVPLYLVCLGALSMMRSSQSQSQSQSQSRVSGRDATARATRVALRPTPQLLAVWGAATTVLFGFVAFQQWLQRGGSYLDPQLLRGIGLAATLLVFAAAPVSRRYGPAVTACIGLAVTGSALGASALIGAPAFGVVAIAISAGIAFAVPGLIAAVASYTNEATRGRASAVYTLLLFLGASLAAPLVGPPAGGEAIGGGSIPALIIPSVLLLIAAAVLGLTVVIFRATGTGRAATNPSPINTVRTHA